MLQITDVSKQYITGSLVQRALDHVSLTLRDNEFVSILGPSGSGKTTLLNVIGGLDHYDSGDLIINGISTKKYTHRDWDSYRNHTIGFVFQSYNLIPHQDVISNVEMALTISGISGKEKRRRAKEALERVGLGEQLHKRPNQMSGGQMQRVAIARALVNDPDILLADEPTGALDSETSIQVMELLKEVAKDRLVVMVTHNPELAEQYATRIVRLKDGRIIDDTDPFRPELDSMPPAVHKNMGKASMSYLTALSLSFHNLRTKKARTILTAFAGSIGIIGIALILSMSNGANAYIDGIQTDTLSEYPLDITRSGMDLSSLMTSGSDSSKKSEVPEGKVREYRTLDTMLSKTSINDLRSLKRFIESNETDLLEYTTAVEYRYNVEPLIYREIGEDDYRQVNPDVTFSSYRSGSDMAMLFTSMRSTQFHVLPDNPGMYEAQYEVLAGKWPEAYNECVAVLSRYGTISDLCLYAIGIKDSYELDDLLKEYAETGQLSLEGEAGLYDYEDFLGIELKLVDPSDCYVYNEEYDIYESRSDDHAFMQNAIKQGETLKIVGVVRPGEDVTAAMLQSGISYSPQLNRYMIEKAEKSEIVAAQLADPDRNVFTGKVFGEEDASFDMESLFSFDEESFSDAFDLSELADEMDFSEMMGGLDASDLMGDMDISSAFSDMDLSSVMTDLDISKLAGDVDLSEMMGEADLSEIMSDQELSDLMKQIDFSKVLEKIDLSELAKNIDTEAILQAVDLSAAMADVDLSGITAGIDFSSITISVNTEALTSMFNELLDGYTGSLAEGEIPSAEGFAAYISGEEAQAMIQSGAAGFLDIESIRTQLGELIQDDFSEAVQAALIPVMQKVGDQIMTEIATQLTPKLDQLLAPIGEELQKQMAESMSSVITAIMTKVSEQMKDQITDVMNRVLSEVMTRLGTKLTQTITASMTGMMTQFAGRITDAIASSMSAAMTSMMEQLSGTMSENLSSAMSEAFKINMSGEELTKLFSSMMSNQSSSYSEVLSDLNYADFEDPYEILIYPKDFKNKEMIVSILDDYNQRMEQSGQEEKVIVYTDYVATMMSSITTIINAVSYVLMAFVSISLVVSSIMIGIITYISVLERTKEIGILRALGASKRNVSQVFNAETFIIGLLSGLFGIGISLALLIPINLIIQKVAETNQIHAQLSFVNAALLIALSVLLTVIGGLIPSRKASRMDPVTALRTE